MARLTTQDFQLYRGDTKRFTLSFKNTNGTPVDITGHVIWFTMKRDVADPDSGAVLQKRIVLPSNGMSVAGLYELTLTSGETGAFEPGLYVYDIQRVIEAISPDKPDVTTLVSGRIGIVADVTRSDGS